MDMHVFVYGTLRGGEINDIAQAAARRGLAAPVLVGSAVVPGVLYDFGDWPGLVEDAAGPAIVGDVYRIDTALLAVLDEIEQYEPAGGSCFVRRSVRVSVAGRDLDCHYYPVDPAYLGHARRTEATDWVAYRQSRTN
jgi:gamma-glutamylcyclotransferase (GGCT)/AIG2-like uncharacterized protein YtfP